MTWRFSIVCSLAAGLDVGSCCLAHVNRSYLFSEAASSILGVSFAIRNVTRQVDELQPKLTFQLRAQFTVLIDAQGTRHRSGQALHRSRHMRVLRPLQSSAS